MGEYYEHLVRVMWGNRQSERYLIEVPLYGHPSGQEMLIKHDLSGRSGRATRLLTLYFRYVNQERGGVGYPYTPLIVPLSGEGEITVTIMQVDYMEIFLEGPCIAKTTISV